MPPARAWILVLATGLGCGVPAPPRSAHLTPPPAAASCAQDRARLDDLARAGRIERLYRETAPERVTCSALRERAKALHVEAAAALGLCDEAPKGCTPVTDPDALIERASGLPEGAPQRRRLFDRASRALDREGARKVQLETVSSPNDAMLPRVTFSDDGRWVAGVIGTQATIVDTNAHRRILAVRCASSGAPRVAFGDGFVATLGCEGPPEDRSMIAPPMPPVHVYRLPSGREAAERVPDGSQLAVRGSLLAVTDGARVTVFDVHRGAVAWTRPLQASREPDSYVPTLAFDAAASQLLVRQSSGALTVFDVRAGTVRKTVRLGRKVPGFALFTPGGENVLDGSPLGEVASVNVASGRKRVVSATSPEHVVFSRDGKQAALWGEAGTTIRDVGSWAVVSSFVPKDRRVLDVVATAKGFVEADTDQDGHVSRLALPNGASAALGATLHGRQSALSLSPDAERWGWMSSDDYFEGNPLHLATAEGTETFRSHTEAGSWKEAALAGDASRLAVARDEDLVLFRLPSGTVARKWPIGGVTALAFSRDGATLVVAHADAATGGVVVALDTNSGKVRFRVAGVYGALLALSPDGTALAIGASGGDVRFFRVPSGREIASAAPPRSSSSFRSMQFESDTVLALEGYAIDLRDVGAGWQVRTEEQWRAAQPVVRCAKGARSHVESLYSRVSTVTNDCRFALVVTRHDLALVTIPSAAPVLVFESAWGTDDLFAGLGDGSTLEKGDYVRRGAVQPIGEHARALLTCRIGARVLPMELCDERFIDPELVARFLGR